MKNAFPKLNWGPCSDQWPETTKGEEIIHKACVAALEFHLSSKSQSASKQAQADQELCNLMLRSPIYELIWRYAINSRINRNSAGGKKHDYWGSFFLLAVSQHLRDKKAGPRWDLCHKLLLHFRETKNPKPSGKLAETKVSQLKARHRQLWESDLVSLHQLSSVLSLD
jgi:hypothetical protein